MDFRPFVYGVLIGLPPLIILFLFWFLLCFAFLAEGDADSYRRVPENIS